MVYVPLPSSFCVQEWIHFTKRGQNIAIFHEKALVVNNYRLMTPSPLLLLFSKALSLIPLDTYCALRHKKTTVSVT